MSRRAKFEALSGRKPREKKVDKALGMALALIKSKYISSTGKAFGDFRGHGSKDEKKRLERFFFFYFKKDHKEKAITVFSDYLDEVVEIWLSWDDRNRSNFVGFICSNNRVKDFKDGRLAKEHVKQSSKKIQIAGFDEDWDL